MLSHKTSLNELKKTEIISSIFANCSAMRLEINYRKENCKRHKYVEAKQYSTKQPMGHWRNWRGNQKIPQDKWKLKHNDPKAIGHSKSSSKRKV